MNLFLKVGRIYWIKPKAIYGHKSKLRPGIMLCKFSFEKNIFIQLGSKNSFIPTDVKANKTIEKYLLKTIENRDNQKYSFVHLDISKPEWVTSCEKPYVIKGKYIDIDYKSMKKLRGLYYERRKIIEKLRMKNAKKEILNNNDEKAIKQLNMLKDLRPIKYSKMNVKKLLNDLKFKIL